MSGLESEAFVFPGEILKSFSDTNRTYKHITLKNNLEVILCSHPGTEKSACCCSVAVGSLQNPDEYPGLAHFLEHLLFMGTEEYPVENEYSVFLAKHGGFSNAYTASEETVYYFDVLADHLQEALGRFSSFFKCPLFNADSTEREMKAVNSENDKNLQSDMWRFQELLKSLSKAEHPYSKFGTGNLETLGGTRPDSTLGTTAREACIAFHKRFYSANMMKVCVYGKESLEQLQQWAEEAFKGVEDKALPAHHVPLEPFGPEQLGKYLEVVPVKDEKTCSVLFPLPSEIEPRIFSLANNGAVGALQGYDSKRKAPLYHSQPIRCLSHLLGHEGEGSILHALKKKNLASGLSSYLQHEGTSFSIMCVRVEFTDFGADKIDEIVACVFSYLGMVFADHKHLSSMQSFSADKDCEEKAADITWIPQEVQDMNACTFRYQDEGEPADFVVDVANNLHVFPVEHALSASKLLYDVRNTQQLMIDMYMGGASRKNFNYFSVENSVVIVCNQAYSGRTSLKERWYGTDYNIYKYAERGASAERWRAALDGKVEEWRSLVHLPRRNSYLPTDFSLRFEKNGRRRGRDFVLDATNTPTLIEATYPTFKPYEAHCKSGSESAAAAAAASVEQAPPQPQPQHSVVVWHQPDHVWGQPKNQIRVRLWVPHLVCTESSPTSYALSRLYRHILEELLIEDLYYADCAKLSCNITMAAHCITLYLNGYSHKIHALLNQVVDKMLAMASGNACSADVFERARETNMRSYHNDGIFCSSFRHAMAGSMECMSTNHPHALAKYDALKRCTLAQFEQFCKEIIAQQDSEDAPARDTGTSTGGGLGAHLECFFFGNITKQEALSVVHDTLLPKLKLKPLAASAHAKPDYRLVLLQPRTEYVYRQHCSAFNPDEPNSAVENCYYIQELGSHAEFAHLALRAGLVPEKGVESSKAALYVAQALVALLQKTMHEAAFNQLRTIEQLGYVVNVSTETLDASPMLRVIVQSSVKDAAGLNARIENFLRLWSRDFLCADDEDYSDLAAAETAVAAAAAAPSAEEGGGEGDSAAEAAVEEEEEDGGGAAPTAAAAAAVEGPSLADPTTWNDYKQSLIDSYTESYHSFRSEASYKWGQIDSCRYNFEHDFQMVAVLEQVTFEEFRAFFNKFIRATNVASGMGLHRRKFTSQFFGKGTFYPARNVRNAPADTAPAPAPAAEAEPWLRDTGVVHIDNPTVFRVKQALCPVMFTRR